MIRHLPFFKAIGSFEDHDTAAGKEHLRAEFEAALLVLRLFDDWVDNPGTVLGIGDPRMRRELKVNEIQEGGVRHLFMDMLHMLDDWKGGHPARVVGSLAAYALLLEEEGWYELAEDILATIADAVQPPSEPIAYSRAILANQKLGDLAIRRRDFDAAERYYEVQRIMGEASHDIAQVLDARIRHAGVRQTRGNLGEAEIALTAIVEETWQAQLPRVEAFARRSRGAAMLRQNRPGDAFHEYYLAYTLASDQLEREWLLVDLASCASLLGLLDTARVVHQTLSQRAVNPATRSLALVNLLEIAVWDNDPAAFDLVWQDVIQRDLARDLRLHALLYRAKSLERWKTPEAAAVVYAELAMQAQVSGVHDLEFQALEAIERLQHYQEPSGPTDAFPIHPPAEPAWEGIAKAIKESCLLQLNEAMRSTNI